MRTDTELKIQAFDFLNQQFGLVETERFIALMQREKFDYTTWRQTLFAELTGEEISRQAMVFSKNSVQ